MAKKQKLELTWVGKDERPKLEPRILIEDADKSYHAKVRHGDDDIFDNILIKGDNLLALKALEHDYAGKVKCIFIDPPYNTGSAFEHYDDGLEHSLWLSLIRDRLTLLHRLLSDDGSIWVTLDDNESFYFKILCDEVFGRNNFIGNIVWQKRTSPANDALYFSKDHDNLLVFAKNKSIWRPNRLPLNAEQAKNYKNPDNDPRGPWNSAAYTCAKSIKERPNLYYPIIQPKTGKEIFPKKTRVWAYGQETHKSHVESGMIYWGAKGDSESPRIKKFLTSAKPVVPRSIWTNSEVGHNQEARMESLALFPDTPFSSPKPERLMSRVIQIASSENDLVVDSFAGSGTTAAVAHKMKRRWIAIEIGDHADTHIAPRLHKVIDGEDRGGITKSVNWKGGGGFRYYTLAPSLLETDKFGNWVISKDYNPAMLSEAMCKHMGFKYDPSQDEDEYWKHGYSTEADFIYVTTQNLTHDACKKLSDEVGEGRSLLICCKAYSANAESFDNLTLVKIPTAILAKCEWGQDDYSLNVDNLPMADALEEDEDSVDDLPLFAEGDKDA